MTVGLCHNVAGFVVFPEKSVLVEEIIGNSRFRLMHLCVLKNSSKFELLFLPMLPDSQNFGKVLIDIFSEFTEKVNLCTNQHFNNLKLDFTHNYKIG